MLKLTYTYQIPCAASSVSGMAITSPNAQTFLSVQNALLKDMITTWTPAITLFTVPTANLIILPPQGTALDGRMRRKFFLSSTSITSVLSRPAERLKTAGKTSCSRLADSYSNAVSPTPAKDSCPTCELLAKKLLEKFPDMANELKDLIPSKVLSPSSSSQKPTPQSKPPSSDTSKSSKSSSPDLPKSSASTKTTKPSPQSSNIQKPHPSNSTNDVASQQQKLKTSNTSIPTSVAPSKPHRSNSTNHKGPSAAPRRQQKLKPSVEYEPPPQIETTNRFQNLEDMEADQEDLEGDASDSEEYHPDDDWNKNIESWSTSTVETKIIKS